MSPEQVRGHSTDYRSDIFSFGAILYEMITGRRAFRRETMAETMSAILKEEPDELSESNPNISPSLERIVRRCLEKKPERRFQSTSDLGFALEALSTTSSSGASRTQTAPTLDTAASQKLQRLAGSLLDALRSLSRQRRWRLSPQPTGSRDGCSTVPQQRMVMWRMSASCCPTGTNWA